MRDGENMLSPLHPKSNGNLRIFFRCLEISNSTSLKNMYIYVHIYACMYVSPFSEFACWTKHSSLLKLQHAVRQWGHPMRCASIPCCSGTVGNSLVLGCWAAYARTGDFSNLFSGNVEKDNHLSSSGALLHHRHCTD